MTSLIVETRTNSRLRRRLLPFFLKRNSGFASDTDSFTQAYLALWRGYRALAKCGKFRFRPIADLGSTRSERQVRAHSRHPQYQRLNGRLKSKEPLHKLQAESQKLVFPNPPQLVIFDCDGVLVDSEPIFNRVLHDFLLSCGAVLSFQECCNLFIGKSRRDVERYLADEGLKIPKNWSEDFSELAFEALRREVTSIKGVRSVLRKLIDAKVPFCVASNGLMEKMQVTLKQTQMLAWFEGSMFSATEIGLCKPAPDVFLRAAMAKGVSPKECVVIEDSASGFESAANAGMACFAYCPEGGELHTNLFGARPFLEMRTLPALLGLA